MLHYNRIDLSEGIDPVKRNTSEECIVITIFFFFFFFFIHGFKFPNPVFFCQDFTMLCPNISYINVAV